ncbi:MAG: 50S ribosomal protein L4 [Spirochaetia bacterium]
MKTQVYALDGTAVREMELADAVWNRDVSEGAIYHAIRNELANKRLGTAKIKDRGEVHGSNKKPWKQKGTGRARAGQRTSPVWVGGGKIFGPRPRDYSYSLPRKLKRLALMSILSLKAKEDRVRVVQDFTVETGKTKDLVTAIKKLVTQERTVVVLKDADAMIRRAGRNVPWISFLTFNRLAAHDLFYCHKLLVLETAAKNLNEFYGSSGADNGHAADAEGARKTTKAAKPAKARKGATA